MLLYLPLHYNEINLVPLHRIELQITDYKTVVIPFNYKGKLLAPDVGIEPT